MLGNAATAVLTQARLAAELPAAGPGPEGTAMSGRLPDALHEGFSTAMGQSILLPGCVILVGAALALFFAKPQAATWGRPAVPASAGAEAGSGTRQG